MHWFFFAAGVAQQVIGADFSTGAFGNYTPVNQLALENFIRLSDQVDTLQGTAKVFDFGLAYDVYVDGVEPCFNVETITVALGARTETVTKGLTTSIEPWNDALANYNNGDRQSWDTQMKSILNMSNPVYSDRGATFRYKAAQKSGIAIMVMRSIDALYNTVALAQSESECTMASWDKSFAFCYGRNSRWSPFEVFGKRDNDFPNGIDTKNVAFGHYRQGQKALKELQNLWKNTTALSDSVRTSFINGNISLLEESRDAITTVTTVTFIRAAIKYSYKLSNDGGPGIYSAAAHAEGSIYWRTISAWVATYNQSVAVAVENAMSPTWSSAQLLANGTETHCTVKSAVESAYEALGIDCGIVGTFKDILEDPCPFNCSAPEATPLTFGIATLLDDSACSTGNQFVEGAGCLECAPGTYNPQEGENCRPCPSGSFAAGDGNFQCTFCPVDTYSEQINKYVGAEECIACAVGFVALTKGSTECILPPPTSNNAITSIAIGAGVFVIFLGAVVARYFFVVRPRLKMAEKWWIITDDMYHLEGSPSLTQKMKSLLKTTMHPQYMGEMNIKLAVLNRSNAVTIQRIDGSLQTGKKQLMQLSVLHEFRHENVARLRGIVKWTESFGLVYTLCPRGDIRRALQNLSVTTNLCLRESMVQGISRGMSYLHKKGASCNGAFCLDHLVVDSKWNIKIMGFGISQNLSKVIKKKNIEKALYYAAPGVIAETQKPSWAGDIFSFSLIAYYLLTRREAHETMNVSARTLVDKIKANESLNEFNCDPALYENLQLGETIADIMFQRKAANALSPGTMAAKIEDVCETTSMASLQEARVKHLTNILEQTSEDLVKSVRRSDYLLKRLFPKEIADQLANNEEVPPKKIESASVLVAEVTDFSLFCSRLTEVETVDLLNLILETLDNIIKKHDFYKMESTAESVIVVGGLPHQKKSVDPTTEMTKMAFDMVQAVHNLNVSYLPNETLSIKVGIHSGPVVVAVVGNPQPRYSVLGQTLTHAKLIQSTCSDGEVDCSSEVAEKIKMGNIFSVEPREKQKSVSSSFTVMKL